MRSGRSATESHEQSAPDCGVGSLSPGAVTFGFQTLTAEAIWEHVQDTQVPFLRNLYECWQEEHEYEDFSEYRAAAFESCPGLTQLWERPFRAEYAAADGKMVLRFRLTDEGIEVAADITK